MTTTYKELKRRVMLKFPRSDGLAVLTVEQSINDALQVIASVHDFDELITLDTTNAATVDGTKQYNATSDWGLTRPKDFYSIRLMDEANSRKLKYVPPERLDELIPYTELTGEGKPSFYTYRGVEVELFRIPDDAYSLYIQYSQWPATLDEDADEIEYTNIDSVIVQLAFDMALSSLEGGSVDWQARAIQLLGIGINQEIVKPDRTFKAQPFRARTSNLVGEYWLNPWVKSS